MFSFYFNFRFFLLNFLRLLFFINLLSSIFKDFSGTHSRKGTVLWYQSISAWLPWWPLVSCDLTIYHTVRRYFVLLLLFIALYCAVLYYVTLHYICIILYRVILYGINLCHIVLYCVILYCIISFDIVSYYFVLHKIITYCVILCCVI